MVECISPLDSIFGSLADPTRRDILKRVTDEELTVTEIATRYEMSLAAISKHLKIMQQARLITKRRDGKHQLVSAMPIALQEVQNFMNEYEDLWVNRLDNLDKYLKEE